MLVLEVGVTPHHLQAKAYSLKAGHAHKLVSNLLWSFQSLLKAGTSEVGEDVVTAPICWITSLTRRLSCPPSMKEDAASSK